MRSLGVAALLGLLLVPAPAPATGLASAARGAMKLSDLVRSAVPELGLGK